MRDIIGVGKEILDSIGESVLLVNKDYKIIFVNRAMLQLFGQKEAEVIGQKCHDFFHRSPVPCHENDTCPVECPHSEVFKTGKTISITHPHIMPDSSERVFEITASPVRNEKGNVIQMIEILRDVTEKKRAEEMIRKQELFLSSVLESIGDGVVVIGKDFKIISANSGYLKQTKSKISDVIGKYCHEVSHHVDKPCYLLNRQECSVKTAYETGSSNRVIHKHFDKDHNIIDVETIAYPLIDPDGSVNSVVEIVTDITERMKLDKEIKNKIKELEDFYEMSIGRELKMVELKEEIKGLKKEMGKD